MSLWLKVRRCVVARLSFGSYRPTDVAKYNELFQAERKFITYEYWQEHLHHSFDFDDLIYGHETLQTLTEIGRPETIYGLQKYLYDIILRRMEVQAESRSVNSIDVIFNMAAVGFTGYVRMACDRT
jgi:hypothetical protein